MGDLSSELFTVRNLGDPIDPTIDVEDVGNIRKLGSRDVPTPPVEPLSSKDIILLPSREDRKFALSIAVQMTLTADGIPALLETADAILAYITKHETPSI